jgi:Trk-type K+ transport system membrane component
MRFIYAVVFVTMLIESIGATFLYFSLDDQLFARRIDKLFFSVFHSVSAFCNAGFSTYSYGLYQYEIRHDYNFHLILAMLVILGGMGFPIVFNLYRYLRIKAINFVHFIFKNPSRENMPNVIMLNSRLALLVNLFLLLLGFVAYIICL